MDNVKGMKGFPAWIKLGNLKRVETFLLQKLAHSKTPETINPWILRISIPLFQSFAFD